MFAKKYQISHLINKGNFGVIFQAKDLQTQKNVAIKTLNPHKSNNNSLQLENEIQILKSLDGNPGIPHIFLIESDLFVMELLGKSLDEIFEKNRKKFSLESVIFLTKNLLKTLKMLADNGIIHQDISPKNICLGLESKKKFFFIDFGLAKRVKINITEKEDNEIINKTKEKFIGTLLFASINAHLGNSLSFIDDLESFFYMILYFLNGSLPWEKILKNKEFNFKEDLVKIQNEKINFFKEKKVKFPKEISESLDYITNFKGNKPDYLFLINKFKNLYLKITDNGKIYKFEWDLEGKKDDFKRKNSRKIAEENNEELKTDNINVNIKDFEIKIMKKIKKEDNNNEKEKKTIENKEEINSDLQNKIEKSFENFYGNSTCNIF